MKFQQELYIFPYNLLLVICSFCYSRVSYLPPKSLCQMEYAPLDLHIGKEQAKNTPKSLFKIDGYLADLRIKRKHLKDWLQDLYKKKRYCLNNSSWNNRSLTCHLNSRIRKSLLRLLSYDYWKQTWKQKMIFQSEIVTWTREMDTHLTLSTLR